jgi:hypothetical protein
VKRTVTTDAASAHADKEAVPEVSGINFVFDSDAWDRKKELNWCPGDDVERVELGWDGVWGTGGKSGTWH